MDSRLAETMLWLALLKLYRPQLEWARMGFDLLIGVYWAVLAAQVLRALL